MAEVGQAFMQQFFAPALSVAIVRNGRFVFERPFGMADKDVQLQTSPTTLFRIASATKPITSVAIFTLIEQGKLNLTDKVFGPSGVLGNTYGKPPYKQYVTDVTVDDLLTHTSGGWPNDSTDPMFRFKSWDQAKLITWTLENLPLTYPPGQHWAYSNFGYCVLGRVIEKVTGQPYKDYVQQAVLAPCGITDMAIAGNTLKQRQPNEAMYVGQFGENPYNMNVTRMDSHGGWIANPSDLARFCSHVGGMPGIPSILKPETIQTMTTPAPAYPASSRQNTHAAGWCATTAKATGGTAAVCPAPPALWYAPPSGMCWGALTNTRTQPSDKIDTAIDQHGLGHGQQSPRLEQLSYARSDRDTMTGYQRTLRLLSALFIVLAFAALAVAQEPLPNQQPVNVIGHWIISAKNWNGDLDTKTVDLQQNGNADHRPLQGPRSVRRSRGQRERPSHRLPHQDQASLDLSRTGRRRHHDGQLSRHGQGRRISRRANNRKLAANDQRT